MKLLLKENYLEDPGYVREIALSLDDYRVNNDLASPGSGWKGQRSFPLRELNNPVLNDYAEQILKDCIDYFDLEHYIHPYAGFHDFPSEPIQDPIITTYFHITTEETRKAFCDFSQDRYHKDYNTFIAGVIYLTPDAPLNSGTSILGENNKMWKVENKYNRLVAYEGHKIHALSDVFGESIETGRLTLNFFIHEPRYLDNFD